ncbi:helix-turn-helix transcriptional regulator [bacterium]|nr:helix-turn-helix transcriptional regulator [bacterium]
MIVCKLDDLLWQNRTNAKDLSKATGISTNTLSRLKNNKNIAYEARTIDLICKYFKCKIGDFLEYIPD